MVNAYLIDKLKMDNPQLLSALQFMPDKTFGCQLPIFNYTKVSVQLLSQ